MIFSKRFNVVCPDGYVPITVPGDWRKKDKTYGFQSPKFSLKLKPTSSTKDLLYQMTECLIECFDINSICIGQLSKKNLNDFCVGINLDEEEARRFIIERQYTRNSIWEYLIDSNDIYIFQKVPILPSK